MRSYLELAVRFISNSCRSQPNTPAAPTAWKKQYPFMVYGELKHIFRTHCPLWISDKTSHGTNPPTLSKPQWHREKCLSGWTLVGFMFFFCRYFYLTKLQRFFKLLFIYSIKRIFFPPIIGYWKGSSSVSVYLTFLYFIYIFFFFFFFLTLIL